MPNPHGQERKHADQHTGEHDMQHRTARRREYRADDDDEHIPALFYKFNNVIRRAADDAAQFFQSEQRDILVSLQQLILEHLHRLFSFSI